MVLEGSQPERVRDIKILSVDTKVYDTLFTQNQEEGVVA
jgi:hypothetical protein